MILARGGYRCMATDVFVAHFVYARVARLVI